MAEPWWESRLFKAYHSQTSFTDMERKDLLHKETLISWL